MTRRRCAGHREQTQPPLRPAQPITAETRIACLRPPADAGKAPGQDRAPALGTDNAPLLENAEKRKVVETKAGDLDAAFADGLKKAQAKTST